MTPFSASDAALEGFNLIRRRWRVVLGWAGFNLVILVMLVVLMVLLSLVAQSVGGGGLRTVQMTASVVIFLGSLFVEAIIAAGVFRLDLRPDEPAFLHLRLGRDELRLAVVWLIFIAGAALVGTAVGIGGSALGLPTAWRIALAILACAYLSLRFLLVAPISFAERRIDFARSWRLTRRRVGALVAMSLLDAALIGLVVVTVFVAVGLIAAGSAGFAGVAALFGGAEALKAHPGIYLLQFAVEIFLTPVLWVLALAPLAAAYRALAAAETP
jgi:hypothetical protein